MTKGNYVTAMMAFFVTMGSTSFKISPAAILDTGILQFYDFHPLHHSG
uniref:Uncharacterized protein n=1 Tax=Anguilla anguilla TaxID=7936 RepID=A0A0E9WZX4_ANGAN